MHLPISRFAVGKLAEILFGFPAGLNRWPGCLLLIASLPVTVSTGFGKTPSGRAGYRSAKNAKTVQNSSCRAFQDMVHRLPSLSLPRLFGFSTLLVAHLTWAQTGVPVSFELAAHSTAVAIQFDVNGPAGTVSWSSPSYQGSSAHLVEIGPIGGANSGKTRYVIFSASGEPISPSGKVTVDFASTSALANGMVTIDGVVASNASGQAVSASPTALPVSTATQIPRWSAQAGQAARLSAPIVDLDGSVTNVAFSLAGQAIGSAAGAPPVLLWNATGSGLRELNAVATDNAGRSASVRVADLYVYNLADVNSYAAFRSIHFGPGAAESATAFGADPHGTGVRNGIAFVLGLNPRTPDLSLLPRGEMRTTGLGAREYVFTFSRPAALQAGTWSVQETTNFGSWSNVPITRIAEGPVANDRVPVEARVPASAGRSFLRLLAVPPVP